MKRQGRGARPRIGGPSDVDRRTGPPPSATGPADPAGTSGTSPTSVRACRAQLTPAGANPAGVGVGCFTNAPVDAFPGPFPCPGRERGVGDEP